MRFTTAHIRMDGKAAGKTVGTSPATALRVAGGRRGCRGFTAKGSGDRSRFTCSLN
jgi:hypothetical protein